MAGYSGTPLTKKLGIKPRMRLVAINAPLNYANALGEMPEDSEITDIAQPGKEELIHFFVTERDLLESQFNRLKEALQLHGMLWISWPKKKSGVQTDLNENIVREIGLKNGLVDVKICAVDEIWSGLKFVYRLVDRM